MCSGQRQVGGLYLSAQLLQQTAELQANKPHYHHHHQQQISLQQLSAVHVMALTTQTCTYSDSSALECFAFGKKGKIWLFSDTLQRLDQPNYKKNFLVFSAT